MTAEIDIQQDFNLEMSGHTPSKELMQEIQSIARKLMLEAPSDADVSIRITKMPLLVKMGIFISSHARTFYARVSDTEVNLTDGHILSLLRNLNTQIRSQIREWKQERFNDEEIASSEAMKREPLNDSTKKTFKDFVAMDPFFAKRANNARNSSFWKSL